MRQMIIKKREQETKQLKLRSFSFRRVFVLLENRVIRYN